MARLEPFSPRVPRADKRFAGRADLPLIPLSLRAQHIDLQWWFGSYIRERAGRKLGKHAGRIERVTVWFDDVNGPKHGLDIRCRVKVDLPALPSVIVEDRGTDPREAFDKAIAAAEHALVRTLDRRGRHRPFNRNLPPWV